MGLLSTLFAITLLAQYPGPDLIRRAEQLLNSPSPLDRAWGATLAGGLCGPNMEALLSRQLQSLPADGSPVELALLDATLRCQFHPPASTFWHLRNAWPNHTLALLAHDLQTNEAFLLQLRHHPAAIELLETLPSTTLFVERLQQARLTHHITVRSAGRESSGPSPQLVVGAIAQTAPPSPPFRNANPEGYPQLFTYQWFPSGSTAKFPIYLSLPAQMLLRVPLGTPTVEVPPSSANSARFPVSSLSWHSTLVYTSESQFQDRLQQVLTQQADTIRLLARNFTRRSRQPLPILRLSIHVTRSDERKSKRPQLPVPTPFVFPVASIP